jgi:transcription initiation factor TFIIH subunit 1
MAIPVGRTLFKKKEGVLTLTSDRQLVTWTPNSGGAPTVTLNINNITSEKQTTLMNRASETDGN